MKKPSLKIISKGAKEALKNAEDLYSEASLLYTKGYYLRVYFLSQIAIEEIGKTSMLLASVQCDESLKEFWEQFEDYFINHSFKAGKAQISYLHSSLVFPDDYKEIFQTAKNDHKKKLSSLYVDIKSGIVLTPKQTINKVMVKQKMAEAGAKMAVFQERLKSGFFEIGFLKEMEIFFQQPKVRELQRQLFSKKLTPTRCLAQFMSIAGKYKDNKFAGVIRELAGIGPFS